MPGAPRFSPHVATLGFRTLDSLRETKELALFLENGLSEVISFIADTRAVPRSQRL